MTIWKMIQIYTIEYIHLRFISSCDSIKIFDSTTLYTNNPHLKTKRQIKGMSCFMTKNDQHRYNYLFLERGYSYFMEKQSDSTKKFSKTDIIQLLSIGLTIYLLLLVDVFLNRQSAYQWSSTVLHFSPTCSFIRTRQISYGGF